MEEWESKSMKAKVKATGKIINVHVYRLYDEDGDTVYVPSELELLSDETDSLRNRAAIAAMQGMLSDSVYSQENNKRCAEQHRPGDIYRNVAFNAVAYADALITELKKDND